jgi:cardiolipin synthase C
MVSGMLQNWRIAVHMRRSGRIAIILVSGIALFWIIGNLFLEVQLPDRDERYRIGLEHFQPGETLRDLFQSLPTEKSGESEILLLDDNPRAWAARWRLLAEADDSLDISYFILKNDIFGVSFLGHILHKSRKGVRIRILLDAIGTKMSREFSGNDYLDALVKTDTVKVKMYRPLFFRYLDVFLTLNPVAAIASIHDKIILADGRKALIGGRNISEEYFADPAYDENTFYDTDVILSGAGIGNAVKTAFEAQFNGGEARDVLRESVDVKDSGEDLMLAYEAMDAWLKNRPFPEGTVAAIREKNLTWLEDLEKLPYLRGVLKEQRSEPITSEVRLLESRTRLVKTDDPISTSLIGMTRSARKEIFIQSPYLVLSDRIVSLLEDAAARGVHITVLTNSPVSSDNAMSQAFFLEQWPEVLARVPTLRIYVAGDRHNLHSKLGAVDNELALVGTLNLEPISMAVNSEMVAAIWSKQFSRRLLQKPLNLISAGPPGVYEYRIKRDKTGQALRDENGRVEVLFGPHNHSSPDEWKAVDRYWKLVRSIQKIPGIDPLF